MLRGGAVPPCGYPARRQPRPMGEHGHFQQMRLRLPSANPPIQWLSVEVDFFTSFEWWKLDPHDQLVDDGAYCLADPGCKYAVYLRTGRPVTVQLASGELRS
jgi:hypothetical protein